MGLNQLLMAICMIYASTGLFLKHQNKLKQFYVHKDIILILL